MATALPSQIWVVIAAHNEARVIADVVADLRSAGYHVLIVDDGSTDDTAEVAARAGATVVKHPFNLGQGAALQTGLEFALTRGAELLVTFDADGQHSTRRYRRAPQSAYGKQCGLCFGQPIFGPSHKPAVRSPPHADGSDLVHTPRYRPRRH